MCEGDEAFQIRGETGQRQLRLSEDAFYLECLGRSIPRVDDQ